jgi:hypothetical protein
MVSDSFKKKSGLFLRYLFFIVVIIGLFFVLYYSNSGVSGHLVFDVETNYVENESLQGQLSLSMKPGELLPSDTEIVVELGNETHIFLLSDLVSESLVNGSYYIEGKNLESEGQGYGVAGEAVIYPDVNFVMEVSESLSSSSNTTPEIDTEESSGSEDEGNSTTEEETEEEIDTEEETAPITGEVISGSVISETIDEVEGSVNAQESYEYNLEEGQTAEILSSDEDVLLTIEGNTVIVTTEYSESSLGFGEIYLGDDVLYSLVVNLEELEILAKEGQLTMSVVYGEEEITSVSTTLNVENATSSVSDSTIPVSSNVTSNDTLSNVNLSNVTSNYTYVEENASEYSLTQEELFLIIAETGTDNVKITKSQVLNGRLIIKFELGDYWAEKTYDYPKDETELNSLIELDRVKWIKKIAEKLKSTGAFVENVDTYLGNYSIS